MGLKFKIFIGYSILIAILAFTVYLFRKEQVKRNALQKDEKELSYAHRLSEQTYAGLLELATQAETVSVWDESDFSSYHDKREESCRKLQELKDYIHSSGQQARIDSLCLLLREKEDLLLAVMNSYLRLQEVSDIVSEKIPSIVSKVKKIPLQIENRFTTTEPEEVPKKKNFWSIFKKKETKSAYLRQREKEKQVTTNPTATTTHMLYSLNREVVEQQQMQQERLLMQMDSLYRNNVALNQKLNTLAGEFEKEASRRIASRYKQFITERDKSYYTIAGIATLVSLLAFSLYVIVHRDLNRKYRYQRELELSDRENKELLSSKKKMMLSIAHDLRSPLATINGSAELLPKEENEQRKMKYIENISHASEYMLSLVDTLMNFYLLDTGQIQAHASIFNLGSLFREIADSYVPTTQKKSLRLSSYFSGMDVVVSGDKGLLQQVVNNLLSNAVKFTKQGSIRLEAEYKSGELRFSVQDTGCGMCEEEIQKIFIAFERLKNAQNVSGFGLGLAICSNLVNRMNGSIRVESQVGKGSCFIVMLPLPLADGESKMEEDRPSALRRLEGVRFLVIDDDIRQLGIIKEMLRRNHASCDCCQDCRELVAKLRENSYDILLTDIQMPDMDGFAALELLRSSNIGQAKEIPAIALTARMDDEKEYLSRGFAGCIRKPFTMDSLSESVSQVLGTCNCKEWTPDFSLILAGEDNKKEMLEVFVSESRKDLILLHEAREKQDRQTVHDILHKNLPLWEAVRLDFPIEELKKIATTVPDSWTEEDLIRIREIEKAADKLLRYAEDMKMTEE